MLTATAAAQTRPSAALDHSADGVAIPITGADDGPHLAAQLTPRPTRPRRRPIDAYSQITVRGDYRALGVSASAVILGPVGGEGVGARTAQEFGLTLPRFIASPRAVARATVRAIVADRAEIAVVPGPGRTLRAVMDRFPGTGPALNRLTGTDKTMDTVAEHREQQALARGARPMIEKPPPVPS